MNYIHFSLILMVRVMLPGNELVISMETASDYLKEERGGSSFASKYGFCARVVGFEWPPTPPDTIRHLEKELSYLGGLCAASLIKKELKLPPVGQCQLISSRGIQKVLRQILKNTLFMKFTKLFFYIVFIQFITLM